MDAVAERLRTAGLTVVSIEPDQAVVVFQDDANLFEFRRALADYMAGPRIVGSTGERAKSTQWDVFEFIEAGQMRRWARGDRIGYVCVPKLVHLESGWIQFASIRSMSSSGIQELQNSPGKEWRSLKRL